MNVGSIKFTDFENINNIIFDNKPVQKIVIDGKVIWMNFNGKKFYKSQIIYHNNIQLKILYISEEYKFIAERTTKSRVEIDASFEVDNIELSPPVNNTKYGLKQKTYFNDEFGEIVGINNTTVWYENLDGEIKQIEAGDIDSSIPDDFGEWYAGQTVYINGEPREVAVVEEAFLYILDSEGNLSSIAKSEKNRTLSKYENTTGFELQDALTINEVELGLGDSTSVDIVIIGLAGTYVTYLRPDGTEVTTDKLKNVRPPQNIDSYIVNKLTLDGVELFYKPGESVELVPNPPPGYIFDGEWNVLGQEIYIENNTLLMPDIDLIINGFYSQIGDDQGQDLVKDGPYYAYGTDQTHGTGFFYSLYLTNKNLGPHHTHEISVCYKNIDTQTETGGPLSIESNVGGTLFTADSEITLSADELLADEAVVFPDGFTEDEELLERYKSSDFSFINGAVDINWDITGKLSDELSEGEINFEDKGIPFNMVELSHVKYCQRSANYIIEATELDQSTYDPEGSLELYDPSYMNISFETETFDISEQRHLADEYASDYPFLSKWSFYRFYRGNYYPWPALGLDSAQEIKYVSKILVIGEVPGFDSKGGFQFHFVADKNSKIIYDADDHKIFFTQYELDYVERGSLNYQLSDLYNVPAEQTWAGSTRGEKLYIEYDKIVNNKPQISQIKMIPDVEGGTQAGPSFPGFSFFQNVEVEGPFVELDLWNGDTYKFTEDVTDGTKFENSIGVMNPSWTAGSVLMNCQVPSILKSADGKYELTFETAPFNFYWPGTRTKPVDYITKVFLNGEPIWQYTIEGEGANSILSSESSTINIVDGKVIQTWEDPDSLITYDIQISDSVEEFIGDTGTSEPDETILNVTYYMENIDVNHAVETKPENENILLAPNTCIPSFQVTITGTGNETGAGEYKVGDLVTLVAAPEEDYTLDNWSAEDITISDNSFIMPGKNVSITANYKVIELDTDNDGLADSEEYFTVREDFRYTQEQLDQAAKGSKPTKLEPLDVVQYLGDTSDDLVKNDYYILVAPILNFNSSDTMFSLPWTGGDGSLKAQGKNGDIVGFSKLSEGLNPSLIDNFPEENRASTTLAWVDTTNISVPDLPATPSDEQYFSGSLSSLTYTKAELDAAFKGSKYGMIEVGDIIQYAGYYDVDGLKRNSYYYVRRVDQQTEYSNYNRIYLSHPDGSIAYYQDRFGQQAQVELRTNETGSSGDMDHWVDENGSTWYDYLYHWKYVSI